MPGTADALVACVAAMPEQVTSWSATGIGRTHLPVLAACAGRPAVTCAWDGGHGGLGSWSAGPGPGGLQLAPRRPGSPARHESCSARRCPPPPPGTSWVWRRPDPPGGPRAGRGRLARAPHPRAPQALRSVTCRRSPVADAGSTTCWPRAFSTACSDLPTDELRARRSEAEQEETDLSYARRLLHGRLDLLRAERQRRDAPGQTAAVSTSDAELVAWLARALADPPGPSHGLGKHGRVEPSRVGEHRRAAEAAVADPSLSDPAGMDDRALAAAIERLDALQREVGSPAHRRPARGRRAHRRAGPALPRGRPRTSRTCWLRPARAILPADVPSDRAGDCACNC